MAEPQYEPENPLPDLPFLNICLKVKTPDDLVYAVNNSIGIVKIKGFECNLKDIKYVNGVSIGSPKELVKIIEDRGMRDSAVKICKAYEDLGIELK